MTMDRIVLSLGYRGCEIFICNSKTISDEDFIKSTYENKNSINIQKDNVHELIEEIKKFINNSFKIPPKIFIEADPNTFEALFFYDKLGGQIFRPRIINKKIIEIGFMEFIGGNLIQKNPWKVKTKLKALCKNEDEINMMKKVEETAEYIKFNKITHYMIL